MENNKLNHNDVAEVRDEIVKKIKTHSHSKNVVGSRKTHENKTMINNLRHKISKLSTLDEEIDEE